MELLAQSRVETQTTNWSKNIQEQLECQFLEIHAPTGLDLSQNAEYASQAALWGIQVCVRVYCLSNMKDAKQVVRLS